MPNPVSVKWFDSTMAGAPVLTGLNGAGVDWLDACLVNGFGSVTLDSVVVSGNVATATQSAGHGFLDYTVVLIAGATPSGLNGEKRITRTGATTFTFDATGISNQTATGTITAKMAPAGWSILYTATHKRVYQRVNATPQLYRINDTNNQYPYIGMFETMSDVDTGTGGVGDYLAKSQYNTGDARAWALYADGAAAYWFVRPDASVPTAVFACGFFGDVVPYLEPDSYHSALIGMGSAIYYYGQLIYTHQTDTGKLARSYTQSGGAVGTRRYSHGATGYNIGNASGVAYPVPTIGGLLAWPVEIWEGDTVPRGLMPGFFNGITGTHPTDGTLIENVTGYAGRKFRVQHVHSGVPGTTLIDLTGPWR